MNVKLEEISSQCKRQYGYPGEDLPPIACVCSWNIVYFRKSIRGLLRLPLICYYTKNE